MACARPIVTYSGVHNCGSCYPCNVRRKRQWVARLILERYDTEHVAFITLTYDDEHLPRFSWRKDYDQEKETFVQCPEHTVYAGSLSPDDMRLFLYRIRQSWPERLRFFAVGEYGEKHDRPHYHALMFGLPHCRHGGTRNWEDYCCDVCDLVRSTWKKGRIHVGTVTDQSIGYCAGYAAKKLTAKGDPRLVCGKRGKDLLFKHPEFVRMSRRPGIGSDAIRKIAKDLVKYKDHLPDQDVPDRLTLMGRNLPLDKYIKNELRDAMGLPKKASPEREASYRQRMLDMQAAAEEAGLSLPAYAKREGEKVEKIMKAKYEALKQEQKL